MKSEQVILEKIDGIYDIQPPAVIEFSGIEILLLTLGFIVTLSLIVYILWNHFFSIKGKVRRQIKQLQLTHSNDILNTHDTIYQLCYLLREGLKINHIGSDILLPEKIETQQKEWLNFTNNLSVLRYKHTEEHQQDINNIFEKSLYWLRVWP